VGLSAAWATWGEGSWVCGGGKGECQCVRGTEREREELCSFRGEEKGREATKLEVRKMWGCVGGRGVYLLLQCVWLGETEQWLARGAGKGG